MRGTNSKLSDGSWDALLTRRDLLRVGSLSIAGSSETTWSTNPSAGTGSKEPPNVPTGRSVGCRGAAAETASASAGTNRTSSAERSAVALAVLMPAITVAPAAAEPSVSATGISVTETTGKGADAGSSIAGSSPCIAKKTPQAPSVRISPISLRMTIHPCRSCINSGVIVIESPSWRCVWARAGPSRECDAAHIMRRLNCRAPCAARPSDHVDEHVAGQQHRDPQGRGADGPRPGKHAGLRRSRAEMRCSAVAKGIETTANAGL